VAYAKRIVLWVSTGLVRPGTIRRLIRAIQLCGKWGNIAGNGSEWRGICLLAHRGDASEFET
jgi:hypothetical protein